MGVSAIFFWKIFELTGSIRAYLAYKEFFRCHKSENIT
ncbi:MAG: YqzL family protein [bacterium]